MWPFKPPVLEATSVVTFDATRGLLFVAFRDREGRDIDGSIGLDALARGFEHGQRRVRLAETSLLATIAEHGGRWHAGEGFAIREEDAPDALRALQVDVPDVEIDARPLEMVEQAELIGDDELQKATAFADADGRQSLPVAIVANQRSRSWIRSGSKFMRRPVLTSAEIDQAVTTPSEVLTGDDVPYYLAKQLLEAHAQGRKVVLGSRAARAQVLTGDWLPDVSVELANDRLALDVGFRTGNTRVPFEAAAQAGNRRFVKLGRDRWASNDVATRRRVETALAAIPQLERQPNSGRAEAPAHALIAVQETFAALGTINLSESAKALRDQLLDFRRIEPVPPPRALKGTLRDYQQHGYNWLCFLRRYGLSGVLADDMGLGKTIQTLGAILNAHEAGQTDPCLVVCPASVTLVWEREVAKWCDGVKPVVLSASNREKLMREWPAKTVAIASYASVARNADLFTMKVWNYVVLDEAHRIKNHATASAKACKALLARHKLAVTGTPIQNRLADLWSLYDSIMPGHLGADVATFERDFADPERLRRRIEPFKLRRLKTEVAKDLPPLVQELRSVKMLDAQRSLYKALVQNIVPAAVEALRDPARKGDTLALLEQLLRMRQVCAHPRLIDPALALHGTSAKFDEFTELLEDCLEADHKVLVFTQWKQMGDLIREHLVAKQISHRTLDGSVPLSQRGAIVEAFQKPDGPRVLVIGLLAGGEGITLTQADTIIMYDRWWNPAIEDQAIARAHRIGQERPVTAYVLETRDSIEERLANMLSAKRDLAEDLIHVDGAEKRITREELLAVLMKELEAAV